MMSEFHCSRHCVNDTGEECGNCGRGKIKSYPGFARAIKPVGMNVWCILVIIINNISPANNANASQGANP